MRARIVNGEELGSSMKDGDKGSVDWKCAAFAVGNFIDRADRLELEIILECISHDLRLELRPRRRGIAWQR